MSQKEAQAQDVGADRLASNSSCITELPVNRPGGNDGVRKAFCPISLTFGSSWAQVRVRVIEAGLPYATRALTPLSDLTTLQDSKPKQLLPPELFHA